MDRSLSDPNSLQNPLKQFRTSTKRLKIHPLERAALIIVCAQLVGLPWALGGMWLWAQIPSLVVAVIGFVVALIPRNYTEDHTGANRFRLIMWPRLLRFPLFWLGLLLLVYIALQGLNPAWTYRSDGKVWWMLKIPNTEWLPSGVEAPLARWNPWRMMIIYAATWLTVCTVWVAFTRRRTVQMLFLLIAGNGFALAAYGLAQRLMSNDKMFWIWDIPKNALPFSAFVYKNHGGAYLDLTLFVACGIAAWYYYRGLRRLEKSNPAGVWVFFATCTGVAILVSYARGPTLIMLAFLVVGVAAFTIHHFRVPNSSRKPVIAIALVLIFGYFLKTGLDALGSDLAWDRLINAASHPSATLESRKLVRRAAFEMLDDNWKFGTGAGSFRFLFTTYQYRHPELVHATNGSPLWWEHAHCDIVQFPIELGVPGMLLILGAFAWLTLQLVRNFVWQNPLGASLALGLALIVLYAWWDFPFQCPAILMLWWVLAVAGVIWTQLEELNLKG